MIGTLLYVLGSRERQSKLTQEMPISLRSIPKDNTLLGRRFINWSTNRNWQTKVLDTGKVTQLNLPRQEFTSSGIYRVRKVLNNQGVYRPSVRQPRRIPTKC